MVWFILFITLIGILGYAVFIEPRWVVVQEHRLFLKADHQFEPFRFLFLSDLHIGPLTRLTGLPEQLVWLRKLVAQQPYRALLVGGDWFEGEARYLPLFRQLVKELTNLGVPVYAVMGNHDSKNGKQEGRLVAEVLQQAGVCLLRNEGVVIADQTGQALLQIVGLEDLYSYPEYRKEPIASPEVFRERALHLRPSVVLPTAGAKSLPTVLLTHNPDGVYHNLPVQPLLALAGHTHGGQVGLINWLVGWPWFWRRFHSHLPYGSFVTWAGEKRMMGYRLIVSRGIGCAGWPLRFLCPPEVHTITFYPDREGISAENR